MLNDISRHFKICLSLFSWKENILPKEHIVHCPHHPKASCFIFNILIIVISFTFTNNNINAHADVGDDDDGVKREDQQVETTARVDGVGDDFDMDFLIG